MQCQTWQKLILLAASGELGSWRRRRLARHLQTCEACRVFQRHLAEISRLHQPVNARPAPATANAVRALIRARRSPAASAPAWAAWGNPSRLLPAAAALALLLAGIGWLLTAIRPAPPAAPADLRANRPAASEQPDLALEILLTDNVVEIWRAAELNGSATPLEMEMMLLEGLLI